MARDLKIGAGKKTSISCRRRTRATCGLVRIVLQTEMNGHGDNY